LIGSIAELPFDAKEPAELLGIDFVRDEDDPEFAGFGWGRLGLVLETEGGGRRVVPDALVLALHAAEDGEELEGDIDLEFWLYIDTEGDENDDVVLVPLSRFLEVWLPRLPTGAPAIVLVLCNPRRVELSRPPRAPAGVPVWYALGDVRSFAEVAPEDELRVHAAPRWGVSASRWIRL